MEAFEDFLCRDIANEVVEDISKVNGSFQLV